MRHAGATATPGRWPKPAILNLFIKLFKKMRTSGVYVCVFISVWHVFLHVLFHRGASIGLYPAAPPSLYLQPNTAPDMHVYQFVTLVSPQSIITLRPYSVTVPLLLKPHRVWKLLRAHTHSSFVHLLFFSYYVNKRWILLCTRCHILKHDLTIKHTQKPSCTPLF